MVRAKVTGQRELQRQSRSFTQRFRREPLQRGLGKGANLVAEDARQRVSVRTGAARDTIRAVRRRGTATQVRFSVVAGELTKAKKRKYGKSGVHALFLETGTKTQAPRPYLRPAFESKIGAIQEAVRSECAAGLAEAVR